MISVVHEFAGKRKKERRGGRRRKNVDLLLKCTEETWCSKRGLTIISVVDHHILFL